MNKQDMMPQVSMETYVPPTTKPEHLVDPLTNNLQQSVAKHQQGVQDMMASLQQQGQQHLNMQQQRQVSFTMGTK